MQNIFKIIVLTCICCQILFVGINEAKAHPIAAMFLTIVQINDIESLQNKTINAIIKNDRDSSEVKRLLDLSVKMQKTEPDSAEWMAKEALALSTTLQFNAGKSSSLRQLGWVRYLQGFDLEAVNNLKEAIQVAEDLSNQNLIIDALSSLGVIFKSQGNYLGALECFFKIIDISKLHQNISVSTTLMHIGVIYKMQKEHDKALTYYFKALEIVKEQNDESRLVGVLGNIGVAYMEKGDYEMCMKYYQESLDLSKRIKDLPEVSRNLDRIANVYNTQGDLENAESYYLESLDIAIDINDRHHQAIIYCNLGYCNMKNKKNQAAINFDHALTLSTNLGMNYVAMHAQKGLAEYYFQQKKYDLAYDFHVKYTITKDSLFNDDKSKALGRLEQKYEFKVSEMKREKTENEIKLKLEEQINRRNNLQYSLVLIVIVALFILLLFSAKLRIQSNLAAGGVFFIFLLLFEFILVLIDPYVDQITRDEPAFKLLLNAILAAFIYPLHSVAENKLKSRLFVSESNQFIDNNASKLLVIFVLFCGSTLNVSSKYVERNILQSSVNSQTSVADKNESEVDSNLFNSMKKRFDIQMESHKDSAHNTAKKMIAMAKQIGSKRLLSSAYQALGFVFYTKGNYIVALKHWEKVLAMRQEIGDEYGIAATLSNIGNIYEKQANYDTALSYYLKAQSMHKTLGNKIQTAICLGNIGVVYTCQANYPKALSCYFKATELHKEAGNRKSLSSVYGNIGNLYGFQNNQDKALEYYHQALEVAEEFEDSNLVAINFGLIGGIYIEMGNYHKGIEYCNKALDLHKKSGNIKGKSIQLGNIGNAYYGLNELKKAEKYFNLRLGLDRQTGNKKLMGINMGNMGSLYMETGEPQKAAIYLDSAILICAEIGLINERMYFEEIIASLYDTIRDYKLAYIHHEKYSDLKDSLFNDGKAKELGKLEQKHEFELAELQRSKEAEEFHRLESEKRSRSNLLQYSAVLLIILSLVVLLLFSGKLKIPVNLAQGGIFFIFLIFFEFLLVLLDPYVDNWTNRAPAYKLLVNAILAGMIFPLHSALERKLKKRVLKIE